MFNHDYLSRKLMEYLQARARGRENAVRRDQVLFYLQSLDPELTDREMRRLYQALPICSCSVGLFIPRTSAEVEAFREYLSKKAMPLLSRWKTVIAYYPELRKEESKQLTLEI